MNDFGPEPPRDPFQFRRTGPTSEPSVAGSSSRRRCCAASPANLFAKRVGPGATAKQAAGQRYGDCSRTEDLDGSRPLR